jgi:hypothetical protein
LKADTGDAVALQFPLLEPLPYHRQVVAYLRAEEADVWRWACSAESREEHAAKVRDALLKETYRLDRDAHPRLHAICDLAVARLGLKVPVTLYQAGEGAMNASLFFLPDEAHVVFFGAMLDRLNDAELQALLGHELSHHILWTVENGVFHAADRVLNATQSDPRASSSQHQTARRYRLFTEVFADRGSALAAGRLDAATTTLVKAHTGLADVSAASYLKQVQEVLGRDGAATEQHSHPDIFIRARALELWCAADPAADTWLTRALNGPLTTDSLDLLDQQTLTAISREVIAQVLRPRCLRSDAMLAHARRFFAEIAPAEVFDASLATRLTDLPGVHDYVAALLMDFALVDRELEDVPLAASFETARLFGVAAAFDALSSRHIPVTKSRLATMKRDAAKLLERAEKRHG